MGESALSFIMGASRQKHSFGTVQGGVRLRNGVLRKVMNEHLWRTPWEKGQGFSKDNHGLREEGLARERSVYSRTHNEFIGNSPAFKSVFEVIRAIAARECPVIITGETGVGKEMARLRPG